MQLGRPSDIRAENLAEAYYRKLQAYHHFLVALKNYIASGWTIRIIQWVVGARGLSHEQSLHDALEFLDIPREQRSPIVWNTVHASVEALAFMCRLRFSPVSPPQNRPLNTADPQQNQVTNASDQNLSRKRKAGASKESLASSLLRKYYSLILIDREFIFAQKQGCSWGGAMVRVERKCGAYV